MAVGRLPAAENKRICQISGLKSDPGRLNISEVVAYEGVYEKVFNCETNRLFKKWSLSRSGRYERVDSTMISHSTKPMLCRGCYHISMVFCN